MDKVNDQNPSDKIEGEVNLSSGQEVQPEVKPQIENQPGLSSPPPPWAAAGAAVGSGEEKVKVLDGVDSETPAVREVKEPIFKKLIPLIGALVLLLVLFLLITKVILPLINKSKTGGTSSAGKEATLTYWGLWEPESVMSTIIADYQKKYPKITINYQRQSHKDYRERLQSSLAQGEGTDIFRFHSTWWPMLKKDLAPAPTEIAKQINLKSNFFPIISENLEVGGQTYGVPIGFDSLALFYNVKIFKTAGKTPPTTWDDLRRTALDLTVRDDSGRIQIAGVALGETSNVDHFSDILGLMMLQNGADMTNPTGPLIEDALKFYTLFVTTDKAWDKTLPSSTYAFATEKVAMFFAPSWRAFEIKEINPNLEFKTVVVPQLPETKVAWANYWAEGVSAKSKNIQAAWDFLNYLSSKEVLVKFYTTASQTRSFGEPYPRIDLASQIQDDPIAGSFVLQGPYAKTWYLCSRTHDNGINDKIIKYFEDAVNTVLLKKNTTEALKTASQGTIQVLNQYGIK